MISRGRLSGKGCGGMGFIRKKNDSFVLHIIDTVNISLQMSHTILIFAC